MIRWAGTHSAYYRDWFAGTGLRPEDLRTGDDLRQLPLLTPGLLRQRIDDIVIDGVDRARCRVRQTSGTTGEPLRIPCSRTEILLDSFLWGRIYRRYGLRWWHRQAKFAFPTSMGGSRLRRRRPLIFPRRYREVSTPTPEKIAWLANTRPDAIFAGATVLYEIALALEKTGRRLFIPRLFSASEQLLPHMRPLIEERLGGRLWDTYGAVETGPLACECLERHGYHLVPGSAWVEVLDEEDQPARRGRIVCSVLWRRTIPLLRYDLGDEVEWTDEPCPCGRPGPRILTLLGRRVRGLLRLPDGQQISWATVEAVLAGVPGIRQHQIVERPPGGIEYRIVAGPGFEPDGRRRLAANFRERFGDCLRLDIVCVESIARSPGGKIRTVIPAEPILLHDAGPPA